ASNAAAAPSGAPTTVGGAVATGLGQAVTGTLPFGSAPIGSTTVSTVPPAAPPAGLMTNAPLPPVPPYQATVAAAASTQSLPAVAMLQAESAQSAAAGVPLSGAGLTRPPALGVPAPDTSPADLATELGLTPTGLINFAVDYLVFVEGNVHEPGPYLAE